MAPVLGSKSTALEALRGADLTGKTAVVTGANSGLGVETARALAHAGARVIITSRNLTAGQKVADDLNTAGLQGKVVVQQLDLADLSSVHKLARQLDSEQSIDFLILNAGVMACPQAYTKDNFELQVGTNHFGHFELTRLLLNKMQSQGTPVRIVCVSSSAHQMGGFDIQDLHFRNRKYGNWKAYAQSKLCNIMFINELARRTQASSVEAFSLHPGLIGTALWRHGLMNSLFNKAQALLRLQKTPAQGAATTIYAATAPELAGKSGAYLADCQLATPTKQAQDMELSKELWRVTEQQLQDATAKLQT